MPFSKIYKFFKNIVFYLFLSAFISSCGNVGSIFDPKEPIDPDARKRARDNAKEGRGIVFGKQGNKSTTYQFATSYRDRPSTYKSATSVCTSNRTGRQF